MTDLQTAYLAILTQSQLKEFLHYDPETGIFTTIKKTRGVQIGSKRGCITKSGHINIGLNRKDYLAHRLAWLYVYGEFPFKEIDHINRIKTDNRIVNLRESSKQENALNRSIQKNNTSGFKGVTKNGSGWMAQAIISGNYYYLGTYRSPEKASEAYKDFAKKNHGEFFCEAVTL